jgi:hypothetical protein
MRVVARRGVVLNVSIVPTTLLLVARIELLGLVSTTITIDGLLVHTEVEGKVVRRLLMERLDQCSASAEKTHRNRECDLV